MNKSRVCPVEELVVDAVRVKGVETGGWGGLFGFSLLRAMWVVHHASFDAPSPSVPDVLDGVARNFVIHGQLGTGAHDSVV